MGINCHCYSYWGVRTEWNEEFSNDYEEVYSINVKLYGYDKEPSDAQVEVLMDGMSCDYMIFGVQLYDSGDSRWGEMINSNEIDINQSILDNMKNQYMIQFKKLYPQHYDWLAKKPWRLINLVHYS